MTLLIRGILPGSMDPWILLPRWTPSLWTRLGPSISSSCLCLDLDLSAVGLTTLELLKFSMLWSPVNLQPWHKVKYFYISSFWKTIDSIMLKYPFFWFWSVQRIMSVCNGFVMEPSCLWTGKVILISTVCQSGSLISSSTWKSSTIIIWKLF